MWCSEKELQVASWIKKKKTGFKSLNKRKAQIISNLFWAISLNLLVLPLKCHPIAVHKDGWMISSIFCALLQRKLMTQPQAAVADPARCPSCNGNWIFISSHGCWPQLYSIAKCGCWFCKAMVIFLLGRVGILDQEAKATYESMIEVPQSPTPRTTPPPDLPWTYICDCYFSGNALLGCFSLCYSRSLCHGGHDYIVSKRAGDGKLGPKTLKIKWSVPK